MARNFPGEIPQNPEIVEFPKHDSFNLKFWKFRERNQMGKKSSIAGFRKFVYTSREVVLFSGNSGKYCSIRQWKFQNHSFSSIRRPHAFRVEVTYGGPSLS